MLEIVTKSWDDLEFAETGEKVEAQGTYALEFDGQRVLLDLTDANRKAVYDQFAPYLAIGRDDTTTTRPRPTAPALVRHKTRRPDAYYTGMRAWADENGYHYSEDAARPGKFNYPQKLRDAFEPVWDQRETPRK